MTQKLYIVRFGMSIPPVRLYAESERGACSKAVEKFGKNAVLSSIFSKERYDPFRIFSKDGRSVIPGKNDQSLESSIFCRRESLLCIEAFPISSQSFMWRFMALFGNGVRVIADETPEKMFLLFGSSDLFGVPYNLNGRHGFVGDESVGRHFSKILINRASHEKLRPFSVRLSSKDTATFVEKTIAKPAKSKESGELEPEGRSR